MCVTDLRSQFAILNWSPVDLQMNNSNWSQIVTSSDSRRCLFVMPTEGDFSTIVKAVKPL